MFACAHLRLYVSLSIHAPQPGRARAHQLALGVSRDLYFAEVRRVSCALSARCETVACNRVTCHDGTSRCIFSMESASNITAITHTGLEALAAAFAAKKTRVLRCSTRYFAVVQITVGL